MSPHTTTASDPDASSAERPGPSARLEDSLSKANKSVALALTVAAWLVASPAQALDNDLVLSRYATFEPEPCGANMQNICGQVQADQQAFENLALDLGEVFAPRFANPAETLGQAGFAISMMGSLSFIDEQSEYWRTGLEDGDPPPAMFTGHLQIRKGLPFSFEVAGDMAYLSNSEMFAMGAHVKWALHEGFYYFPDVAVRGTVNTILGSEYLNLLTAGWDVSISKDFGLGSVISVAPFAGYQNLYVVSSSRLINAFPQDPSPPQTGTSGEVFAPEFVFEQSTQSVNRFFGGARLNVWIMSFVLEGVLGNNVNQLTLSGGVDF